MGQNKTLDYRYLAKVTKVIDGDTFDVIFDLGLKVIKAARIRLKFVNAPEMSTPEGETAKLWLQELFKKQGCLLNNTLLSENGDIDFRDKKSLWVQTFKDRDDLYGRVLGVATLPDGSDLGTQMLDAKMAKPYG